MYLLFIDKPLFTLGYSLRPFVARWSTYSWAAAAAAAMAAAGFIGGGLAARGLETSRSQNGELGCDSLAENNVGQGSELSGEWFTVHNLLSSVVYSSE